MDDVGVALAPCLERDAFEGAERLLRSSGGAGFILGILVQGILKRTFAALYPGLDAHGGDLEVTSVLVGS